MWQRKPDVCKKLLKRQRDGDDWTIVKYKIGLVDELDEKGDENGNDDGWSGDKKKKMRSTTRPKKGSLMKKVEEHKHKVKRPEQLTQHKVSNDTRW